MYVIAIFDHQQPLGYVHVPKRTCKNPQFITTDVSKAQRFASRHKAMDRAGRYNAMNKARGLSALVLGVAKEN